MNTRIFSLFSLAMLLALSGCAKQFVNYHGHKYGAITAGSQVWMNENLRTDRYRSGKKIELVNDHSIWPDLNRPAWGYMKSDTARLSKYGAWYNWYAVREAELCPRKWHVPTQSDWLEFEKFLGGGERAGGKLKSVKGWKGGHVSADDIGFNGKAGGYRLNDDFQEGTAVVWWSSSQIRDEELNSLTKEDKASMEAAGQIWIWGRRIEDWSSRLWTTANRPANGFYVRCIRDKKSPVKSR